MTVIINATPLIALAILDRLDILRQMFTEVIVPTAVYEEIVTQGAGRIGAEAVAKADWLRIVSPTTTPTMASPPTSKP